MILRPGCLIALISLLGAAGPAMGINKNLIFFFLSIFINPYFMGTFWNAWNCISISKWCMWVLWKFTLTLCNMAFCLSRLFECDCYKHKIKNISVHSTIHKHCSFYKTFHCKWQKQFHVLSLIPALNTGNIMYFFFHLSFISFCVRHKRQKPTKYSDAFNKFA